MHPGSRKSLQSTLAKEWNIDVQNRLFEAGRQIGLRSEENVYIEQQYSTTITSTLFPQTLNKLHFYEGDDIVDNNIIKTKTVTFNFASTEEEKPLMCINKIASLIPPPNSDIDLCRNDSNGFKQESTNERLINEGIERNRLILKDKKRVKKEARRNEKIIEATRAESIAGIVHILVIVFSIVTIAMLARVADQWEVQRRRCPLYVHGTQYIEVYWGNEKMVSCHYGAYMPVILILLSFSFVMLHAGILYSFRSGEVEWGSQLIASRNYPKVMFFLNAFELVLSLSVSCVITDGFRQTCLSFQLIPWVEERPINCKEGYQGRDDAYDIQNTFTGIVSSIATSWACTFLLAISTGIFLVRMKICKR